MCTAAEPAAPSSTGQALAMVRAGLGYLAGCDAGGLATGAQAEALIGLEHAEAQHTAARARILAVFTARHWVGRAARSLACFEQVWAFSARPPAEPRGHLSAHVALQ